MMACDRSGARRPRRLDEGFSLVEVMVAAVLLLIVFYGISQYYVRGRTQLDFEENRRKATAIGEARLDGIRRDFRYDDLTTLNGRDTTYVLENKNFRVSHTVTVDTPEAQATTVTITVNWTERVAGNNVARSLQATTILARGMP
jgi:prepilin-type N-terminal cleavage/methylation domain-containing protein